MVNPLWTFDRKRIKDHPGIIGVDEAGRGCLAGPVVAGAVLLPRSFFQKPVNRKACAEINDSKQIKESQREELFEKFPSARTFPQITIDGNLVGGYTEFAAKILED